MEWTRGVEECWVRSRHQIGVPILVARMRVSPRLFATFSVAALIKSKAPQFGLV